jgi:amino acid transporter
MKFYFDYFYYRITKVFLRYPTDQGIRAISLIVLMQSLVIISIIEICLPMFFGKGEIIQILGQFSWVIALIVLVLFYLNFLNYRRKYMKLEQHWQNEPKAKKILRGVLMIISFPVPFVVYAYITSWIYHFAKGT